MTEEQLDEIFNAAQSSLIALQIHPNDEESVKKALNLAFESMPKITYKQALEVFIHASAGKYGIPFKFVPAIIGSWFHKESKEVFERRKGAL